MLPKNEWKVLGRKNGIGSTTLQFCAFVPAQSEQRLVGENYAELVVNDDHSLVELSENAFHSAQPVWRLDLYFKHGSVH
jgi:hypothetical protein